MHYSVFRRRRHIVLAHAQHVGILVAERNERPRCTSLSAILAFFARRFGLFAEPLRALRVKLLVQSIKVSLRPPARVCRSPIDKALIEDRCTLRVRGLQIVRLVIESSWIRSLVK